MKITKLILTTLLFCLYSTHKLGATAANQAMIGLANRYIALAIVNGQMDGRIFKQIACPKRVKKIRKNYCFTKLAEDHKGGCEILYNENFVLVKKSKNIQPSFLGRFRNSYTYQIWERVHDEAKTQKILFTGGFRWILQTI